LYICADNKLHFGPSADGNCNKGSSATLNDGVQHDIVATWDNTAGASSIHVYIDGTDVSTGTSTSCGTNTLTGYWVVGSGAISSQPWGVSPPCGTCSGSGGPNAGAANWYMGRVAIWQGTALTAGDVTSLHSHISDGTLDTVVLASRLLTTGR